eukprot:4247800-Pleurochrysis_carterae.AAC.2
MQVGRLQIHQGVYMCNRLLICRYRTTWEKYRSTKDTDSTPSMPGRNVGNVSSCQNVDFENVGNLVDLIQRMVMPKR